MLGRLKFDITDLVQEILDQFPEEVWTSSTTTFLDPAMAGGQFVHAIENRLRSAGHSIKNIESRVYGYESNSMRINYAVNKYNLAGTYTAKEFIEEDINMKFDVIVGNPPYQKPGGSDRMGSRGASSIWNKFVFKSISLLKDNGYMSLIHPPSWRKPKERYGLWGELTKNNQMLFLKMRSGRKEQDLFNIGIRFDYYVIQKTPKYKNTTVVDHENKIYDLDLSMYEWLPNYAIDEITKMLGQGCEIMYNTTYHTQHMHSDNKTEKFSNPVVHTINKNGLGIKYFETYKTDIHFTKPKVLLNQNEIQYPVNDFAGTYGMSQLTFGIAIDTEEEGEKIVKFLNSEKGKRLIAATKWNTFYTDYNMFAYFKKDWYDT